MRHALSHRPNRMTNLDRPGLDLLNEVQQMCVTFWLDGCCIISADLQNQQEAEAMTETEWTPLHPSDFEVEKDGEILHVMISEYRPDLAHVVQRGQGGEGPDRGGYAPYDRMEPAAAIAQMRADGWMLKTTKQMIVIDRSNGYNNVTVSGVCSPDVTVEDVKKRFYHCYFGGRHAWVSDGKFGCTIHTD